MYYIEKMKCAAHYVSCCLKNKPSIGIILGSGLGELAEEIEKPVFIKYFDIPHFPVSTVIGHMGQFVAGKLEGKDVIVMQGRIHYYEGYDIKDVTFPVRVLKLLGIEKLIVTNAAGGVNTSFKPGDLMLIKDHINLSGINPLIGRNLEEFGPRFPDMSCAYDKEMMNIARSAASKCNFELAEGVYLMMSGPTYETPAEIRMVRALGGDAVGMSTVPEVIVANHSGIKVLGISCITNMAAGILDQPINHEEVIETSNRVKEKFKGLIREVVKNI